MYIVGKLWKEQPCETWVACELYDGILWMVHNERPHKEFETVEGAEIWIGNSVGKWPGAEYRIFDAEKFVVQNEFPYEIILKPIKVLMVKEGTIYDWGENQDDIPF